MRHSAAFVVVAAVVAACTPSAAPVVITAKAPPPLIIVDRPKARPAPPPEWTFWEPVDADVRPPELPAPTLPLQEKDVVRLGPDAVAWASQSPELKAQLLKDGFCVVPLARPRKIGEYYVHLRELGIPYVVTMDALFHLAHVTLSRVLADVEWRVAAPAFVAMLAALDARLSAESTNVGSDVKEAYTLARGVVAVARALVVPGYAPQKDIAPGVAAELARMRDHIGPAKSDLFGTVIDYSELAPSGDADALDQQLAGFPAAFTWLAKAPFFVASRADVISAPANVATARTQTRAAMIIARLLVTEADPDVRVLYKQFAAGREVLFGRSDDVSPELLARHVTRAGGNLADARSFTNVVTVDRVRHSLITARAPAIYDGVAALREDVATDAASILARSTLSVRLAGDETTQDAAAFTALSFPSTGRLTWSGASPPSSSRSGVRTLPSALDIAAWLGSAEARAELHSAGDDAYERYEAALGHLVKRFDADDLSTRHATAYASLLDAMSAYMRATPADAFEPFARGAAFRKAKLESALSFYASLRHDTLAFTRVPLDALPEVLKNRPATAPPAAFVEPHPETIARLLGALYQIRRGLSHGALLPKDGVADKLLTEAENMLRIALEAAVLETNDVAFSVQLAADLAYLPTQLAEWEALIDKTHDTDLELAADLHTDLGGARVRTLGTGPIEAFHAIVREPETGRLVHAVGAHVPVYEIVQPAALRLSDNGFRARLSAGSTPPRFAFTEAFRVETKPATTEAK